MADKISINYNEIDDTGKSLGLRQLPFSILIMANFSGKQSRETHDSPFTISRKTFNLFFKQCEVNLIFYVKNHLFRDKYESDLQIDIQIDDIQGFHPYNIYAKLPILSDYLKFLRKLEYCVGHRQVVMNYFTPEEQKFFSMLDIPEKSPLLGAADVVLAIAKARSQFVKQVNEIIHNSVFKEVEFNWTSLYWLISQVSSSNCQIRVMDTDKETLEDDLLSGSDISETELFSHIYTKEFDQYGGIPYSLIMSTFSISEDDLQLAQQLGNIGRLASCPILSPLDVSFFGINDISLLSNNFDFEDLRYRESFEKWREFAQQRDSRFIGLFINSCKMRDPYKDLVFYKIPFVDESPSNTRLQGLWGCCSYMILLPLISSYSSFNTCLGLDDPGFNFLKKDSFSVNGRLLDWQPSKRVQVAIETFGIICWNFADQSGNVKLSELNMLNRLGLGKRGGEVISVEQQMNVRLPQLLFIAQLTHYMRIIQRQSISRANMIELRNEINQWLRRFISEAGAESAQLRAQKPLKNAQVNLVELDIKGGKITEFQLSITPHSNYRGLEYSLTI